MSRILHKFSDKKRKILIPFITAGDPDLETTHHLVLNMEKNGADIIELGIPFSDPLADGPIIQSSTQRALNKNTNIPLILQLVRKIRKNTDIPLILMTYFNPIYNYGIEKFTLECRKVGVDGLIISDLPLEEAREIRPYIDRNNLDLIFLLAPTSNTKRIKLIAEESKSFIYCISRTGVTGIRKNLEKELNFFIQKVRNLTSLPLAVGFGISNPTQAKLVSKISDGIIVGSAIVKIVEENLNNKKLLEKVGEFIHQLKKQIN